VADTYHISHSYARILYDQHHTFFLSIFRTCKYLLLVPNSSKCLGTTYLPHPPQSCSLAFQRRGLPQQHLVESSLTECPRGWATPSLDLEYSSRPINHHIKLGLKPSQQLVPGSKSKEKATFLRDCFLCFRPLADCPKNKRRKSNA